MYADTAELAQTSSKRHALDARSLLPGVDAATALKPVLEKAIEIANALLDEGHDEGQAIRMAIAAARKWAARHPDVWR